MTLSVCTKTLSFRIVYILSFLLICESLASCGSSSRNIQLAENSAGIFHAQLDTEQYSSVYEAADENFHVATSESDFVKLLEAIHSRLGTVRESKLRNTGVAWFAGQGATVTLVYDTKFSAGTGTEQFVYHIKDNQSMLYGYHINSNDLVSK